MVKYLVEKGGADIHASDDDAFVHAIKRKNIDIARYLVEHGAIADTQAGAAFISAASRSVNIELVKYLLEETDIDFSRYLDTALEELTFGLYGSARGPPEVFNYKEVIEYLLASGADGDIINALNLIERKRDGY